MSDKSEKMILQCPLRYALNIVGGKWKLPILCILSDGEAKRYSQIKRRIPDITNMMLSQSLKELEAEHIIIRKQYNEVPPRVEYVIAANLDGLLEPLAALGRWGESHMDKNEKGPACRECRNEMSIQKGLSADVD